MSELARLSLAVVVVAPSMLAGCLVTSSPDFTPPEQTRPEIVTSDRYAPSPGLGKFALFQTTPSNPQYTAVEFSAWVQSEDADVNVQTMLLIDYGDESGVSNGPYRDYVPGEPLAAATMADGPREVAIPWRPREGDVGCHTVTLLVTHQYTQREGAYYCPLDPDDASTLTWFALVCDQPLLEDCPQLCPIEGQGSATYCSGVEATP